MQFNLLNISLLSPVSIAVSNGCSLSIVRNIWLKKTRTCSVKLKRKLTELKLTEEAVEAGRVARRHRVS